MAEPPLMADIWEHLTTGSRDGIVNQMNLTSRWKFLTIGSLSLLPISHVNEFLTANNSVPLQDPSISEIRGWIMDACSKAGIEMPNGRL